MSGAFRSSTGRLVWSTRTAARRGMSTIGFQGWVQGLALGAALIDTIYLR